jgi:CRISPR-associated protein Cas2
MKEQPEFAVVYDVSDDRERCNVDRVLKGFGFRAQKSVFECKLSRAERRELESKLNALVLKTGSIKIYRIYGGASHTVIGLPNQSIDDQPAYVF